MQVNISKAAQALSVHQELLRRWEIAGKTQVERTPKGHRRYDLAKLKGFATNPVPMMRSTLCYASVSSHDQKDDLQRQIAVLESFFSARLLI